MVCDKPLHDKLNAFELTKHLNKHTTTMFIGRPGSGKTSLVVSLLKSPEILNKVFHNIYLFMPTQSQGSLKDNIFKDLEHQYEELNYDTLSDCLDKIRDDDKKYNNLVIMDDMGAYLKNKATKQLFKELIYNRRHLRTSVYFLCQTYLSVERDLRKLFSNLFVFKCSKKEMELIADECVEENADDALEISKFVFDAPYNFLFINCDSGRMYKNWDEIFVE